MKSQTLSIDIVSDLVCPWCIIGYRRLLKALEHFPEQTFELRWHPFELNPDMPPEGQDIAEHLAQKYKASADESTSNRRHLEELGQSLGFKISYHEGKRIVNTFRAHQLIHWAQTQGRQTELQLALFEAYSLRHQKSPDRKALAQSVNDLRVPSRIHTQEKPCLDREFSFLMSTRLYSISLH